MSTFKNRNLGKSITEDDRIVVAKEAYIRAFSRIHCNEALQQTGMIPLDRNVILSHPCLVDGNKMLEKKKQLDGGDTVNALKKLPEVPVAQVQAMQFDLFGENPIDNIPDNEKYLEQSHNQFSHETLKDAAKVRLKEIYDNAATIKPRLGPFRQLYENADVFPPDKIHELKVTIENIRNYIEKISSKEFIQQKEAYREKVINAINDLKKTNEELIQQTSMNRQFLLHITQWENFIDESVGNQDRVRNKTMAVIGEKLADMEESAALFISFVKQT